MGLDFIWAVIGGIRLRLLLPKVLLSTVDAFLIATIFYDPLLEASYLICEIQIYHRHKKLCCRISWKQIEGYLGRATCLKSGLQPCAVLLHMLKCRYPCLSFGKANTVFGELIPNIAFRIRFDHCCQSFCFAVWATVVWPNTYLGMAVVRLQPRRVLGNAFTIQITIWEGNIGLERKWVVRLRMDYEAWERHVSWQGSTTPCLQPWRVAQFVIRLCTPIWYWL